MEHVVFSAAEGGAGEEFRRVASLEEAVRVVEHLRNDLGISESSVYALTPVPLEFRAYYRVEVPGVKLPLAEAAPVAPEVPELRVGDLSELSLEESVFEPLPVADVAPHADVAEMAEVAELPEIDERELTDQDFMPDFEGSELAVPTLLPPAAAIPPTRQDGDAERSLGYFAR